MHGTYVKIIQGPYKI